MANYGRINSNGMFCNCHGSQFDADGNVLRGPARRALDHYKVTVNANGDVYVDSMNVVSESTRVAVQASRLPSDGKLFRHRPGGYPLPWGSLRPALEEDR